MNAQLAGSSLTTLADRVWTRQPDAPLRILIIGANGQIGTELGDELVRRHGADAVVSSDITTQGRIKGVRHEQLDCTDRGGLIQVVERHGITQIYHLAAALSARDRPSMCVVKPRSTNSALRPVTGCVRAIGWLDTG